MNGARAARGNGVGPRAGKTQAGKGRHHRIPVITKQFECEGGGNGAGIDQNDCGGPSASIRDVRDGGGSSRRWSPRDRQGDGDREGRTGGVLYYQGDGSGITAARGSRGGASDGEGGGRSGGVRSEEEPGSARGSR